MNFPIIHWNLFVVETLIAVNLIVLILVDMFLPKQTRRDWLGVLSFIGIAIIFGVWSTQSQVTGKTFNGMFQVDALAWFFKGMFLTTMVFVLAMTQHFFKSLPHRKNEFYLLLWLALLGMCLTASSADFVLLFIAIEILTIALYVMTAYLKSDKNSLEAGMKYLILGALTSGFFLYGVSFLYGVTHSTRFDAIQMYAAANPLTPAVLFGIILIFATVGFKIASVPFQLWVPDVYQGAPTPVTALLSVGSKAAGFVILIRLFLGVFSPWHIEWSTILAVLAALTMCYGNLGAMFQTNIKRLLGYSSIGHAGYLLMGAAAGSAMGVTAMNFYLLGYLFTNLAAFTVIILFFVVVKSDAIEDYAGLSQSSGLLAGALLLALVSLAGVPPLVGFFGKFSLLMATVKSGYLWLALIAVVNIVISLYYYLSVVKKIYFESPRLKHSFAVPPVMRLALIILMVGMVAIGIIQGPFFSLAMNTAAGL